MNDKPKRLAPIAIPIHWLMSFIAWWPLFVSGGFSILKNDCLLYTSDAADEL